MGNMEPDYVLRNPLTAALLFAPPKQSCAKKGCVPMSQIEVCFATALPASL